jgi:hypothetical protein
LGYNRDKFQNDCRSIIEKIREKFIDLAPVLMDDENSNYADLIQEK